MILIEFGPVPSASHSIIHGSRGGDTKIPVSTVPLPANVEYPIGVAVGVGVGGPAVGVAVGIIVGVGGTVGTGVGTGVGVGVAGTDVAVGSGTAVGVGFGVAVGALVAVGTVVAVGTDVGFGVAEGTTATGVDVAVEVTVFSIGGSESPPPHATTVVPNAKIAVTTKLLNRLFIFTDSHKFVLEYDRTDMNRLPCFTDSISG